MIRFARLFALLALFAATSFAAVSKEYAAWRSSAVQWIMTDEEQRAWKKVASDEEASRFIDLFWAKRDPTVGTPQNEFRQEFDERVSYADQWWSEGKKPGSLTDRGRVYITLGPATIMGNEGRTQTSRNAQGSAGKDPTGGRQLGAKDMWSWNFKDAQKFRMPKIEVVFIEDPLTHRVQRDTSRNDVLRAFPVAIANAVVNPGLTAVPEWALQGGLEPKAKAQPVAAAPAPPVSAAPPAVPAPAAPAPQVEKPAAKVAVGPHVAKRGASRLTLTRDVYSIQTEVDSDPFASITPVAVFRTTDDLGWAVQFCSGKDEVVPVGFLVTLKGKPSDGTAPIDLAAEPDEMAPDHMRAVPGCYLLRGAIPLATIPPGTYTLHVSVDDPATKKSYDLSEGFRIE